MKRLISVCVLLCCLVSMAQAKVDLPQLFADNMVLQQQSDVARWGKAAANARITITTTWSKAKTVVKADAGGDWFVRIATPAAGGPYEMTFDDGEKLTLKNVLIGEVWICSGQSNMEMQMSGYDGQPVAGAADLIIGADPSTLIRSCNVKRVLAFEPQERCDAQWYEHTPEGVREASATAYMFARKLYEVLKVPVGIINVSWGGSRIEAWMKEDLLRKEFAEIDMSHIDSKVMPAVSPFKSASVLYNGMLHSVAPFTAKGFIWYQGCSNRHDPEQYVRLQPSFVKMLRQMWGCEDMGFYFTQIAPYQYPSDPTGQAGAELIWAQARTLPLIPKSAMATTLDSGERHCIHPANKKVVGDRLAYLALSMDYGFDAINVFPPVYKSFEVVDGKVHVLFDVDSKGLNPINEDLAGFEVAGADGVYYPAVGRVYGKDERIIVVSCPEVAEPVAVRYAMKSWSTASVFSSAGIPASPFKAELK